MDNSLGAFITRLFSLLGKERDGLLLIDGKWGSGKTYFIKTTFKKIYDKQPIFYISLLGIKSLSDFKAKIIDCYYLSDIENLKNSIESITGGVAISQGAPESAGLINGIFSSIGTSVKENILSNLSGLFILDDIERMNDLSVTTEILTYCHMLYSSKDSRALDFIFIGNTSEKSNLVISHKEKLISDTLNFTINTHDICEMLGEKLNFLPDEDKKAFNEIIISHEIVNLRIIQRCIDKIIPIYNYASKNPDLSWSTSSISVLNCIFSALILIHQHDKTTVEMKEKKLDISTNKNKHKNTPEDALWALYYNYRIPELVRSYCLDLTSINTLQELMFFENKPITIEIIAVSQQPYLFNVDENKLLQYYAHTLTRYVYTPLPTWIKLLNNYKFLTEQKYLPKHPVLSDHLVNRVAELFSIDEILLLIESYGCSDKRFRFSSRFQNPSPPLDILLKKYDNFNMNNKINTAKNIILENGWSALDINKHINEVDNLSQFKPLELLDSSLITRAILTRWTIKDIESFNEYLIDLYNFSNINEFLSGEKFHMMKISNMLFIYLNSHNPDFKYGAIYKLHESVNQILTRFH